MQVLTKAEKLALLTEIKDELTAGKPVLVSDDQERENEVDVIFSAASVTEAWLAWCIRNSSGYLCAPLSAEIANKLQLPLMVPANEDRFKTAYTISVDAAVGVTTGISAADRLRTLRVLAAEDSVASDLIRPGHVLPLRGKSGGLSTRQGHTEAALALMELANLPLAAGIIEICYPNGEMVREAEIPDFLATELPTGEQLLHISVSQLTELMGINEADSESDISVHDTTRFQVGSQVELPTKYGSFTARSFTDRVTGAEHMVLSSKVTAHDEPLLVRVHSECVTGDVFGSLRCDCGEQLTDALALIAEYGGMVIYLREQEGRGIGLAAKLEAYYLQERGFDTLTANEELGFPGDLRSYLPAASILKYLGHSSVRLMTNNPEKVAALEEFGISVVERVARPIAAGEHNIDYLTTKRDKFGHIIDGLPEEKK